MKSAMCIMAVTLLWFALSMPAAAATRGCSFNKRVQRAGLVFDVVSRPAIGCAVQVIDVSVWRGGKIISRIRSDVDYLAENAWADDLDGDGQPELLIASRSVLNNTGGKLDVYRLDGNIIHRSATNQTLNEPATDQSPAKTVSTKSPAPLIKDITVSETGIVITTDTPIDRFKAMKLEKPERIAIDIPDASSPLAGKRTIIKKFGISRARVGLNKSFLRIVLDSAQATFPKHTITKTDNGLTIVFVGE